MNFPCFEFQSIYETYTKSNYNNIKFVLKIKGSTTNTQRTKPQNEKKTTNKQKNTLFHLHTISNKNQNKINEYDWRRNKMHTQRRCRIINMFFSSSNRNTETMSKNSKWKKKCKKLHLYGIGWKHKWQKNSTIENVSVTAACNMSVCDILGVWCSFDAFLLSRATKKKNYLFAFVSRASIRFPFIIFRSLFVSSTLFSSFWATTTTTTEEKNLLIKTQHWFILCDAIIVASFSIFYGENRCPQIRKR